jgi:hypothetical protein
MPNTKDHYNVMLTKKLISFQDQTYPGMRRPDLPQTFSLRGSRDRMVVGFTTTYAISAYHNQEF